MARHQSEPGAEALYELHRQWLQEVLPEGGSLLTPEVPIWTTENLDELDRRFIDQPDLTKDKKFLQKLHDQLAGAPAGAVQLMAELHVVHLVHIWNGAISAVKKRSDVETILSWMPTPATVSPSITATFSPGLIHPGQWVLTRRDTQLTWLIRFSLAWRRLDADKQAALLYSPKAFKGFLNDIHAKSADGARLAMLHMTFPDQIESIVSADQKKSIVERYADLLGQEADIDDQLLVIREALQPEYGERFDWYRNDLNLRWWKPKKTWKPFLTWLERFRATPGFDDEERNFKLDHAERLGEVRRALGADDPGWPTLAKKVFREGDSLTHFEPVVRFNRWIDDHPEEVSSALNVLWEGDRPPWERLREFLTMVPTEVLPTRGERLTMGATLLMANGAQAHPPFKISTFRAAARLLGWTKDDDKMDDADVYRRTLLLCEEILHEGRNWDLPMRDLLDAQCAVWALKSHEGPLEGWPDEWWEQLEVYRSSSIDLSEEGDEGKDEEAEAGDDETITTDPTIDHIAQAAKDLNIDRVHLDEIVQLLEDKSQAIFYGPPGTGKTYLALRLARAIAQGDESRVSLVQFHPATTYEDFIEGLRPKLTAAGQVTYEVIPGPLVRIAEAARNDPDHKYVLVVDEINRANLPKVFGELLFLLEYRNEKVRTLHRPGVPFGLPENLWLIGTMNTADRSIALIDAAMRRRFHFVPFFPHEGLMKGLLRRWLNDAGGRVAVAALLDAVNQELRTDGGDHLLIGPSHFMKLDLSDNALERIWSYNVFPVIEEQYWGDRGAIDQWRWSAVRRRFARELGYIAAEVPDDGSAVEDADPAPRDAPAADAT